MKRIPDSKIGGKRKQHPGSLKREFRINLSEALRFVSTLAGGSLTTFVTLPDRKREKPILAGPLHGTLEELSGKLTRRNVNGLGVLMMVNEGDGNGRKSENVVAVRAVFLDLDGPPLEPVLDGPLPPHIVVESSPGRYHVYWRIGGLPLELFSGLQQAFAERFQGDPAVKDLPRLMRVPGFYHQKEKPFRSRIIEINEGDPYPFTDFLEAFELDAGKLSDRRGLVNEEESALDVIEEGGRNSWLMSRAGTMRTKGFSAKAILGALTEENRLRCRPPLDEAELRKIAESVSKYPPAAREFPLTDLGNAERLVDQHKGILRYCSSLGGWLVYDGQRWRADMADDVYTKAAGTVRSISEDARQEIDEKKRKKMTDHAMRCESKTRIEAMIDLAKHRAGVVARPDDFDRNPYLLNVLNGTIDLKTGRLREHRPKDLMTKLAPVEYDEDARCDLWEETLEKIFEGDQRLTRFVQKALGYSLTGDTKEQCWFLLYGTGANGKSTIINTILHVMGNYAVQTPPDTFLIRRNEGPRNDLARLKGARFVAASEPCQTRSMDESIIKSFTGQDSVTCRKLYCEYFEFKPEAKLFLSANHKPDVKGVDHGFWRRMLLIPFTVTIPETEQDKELFEKLKEESAGILNWLLAGCRQWLKHGLRPPRVVRSAVSDYKRESDPLGEFVENECEVGEGRRATAQDLYDRYERYCDRNGVDRVSRIAFGKILKTKGFESRKVGKKKITFWFGLDIRDED